MPATDAQGWYTDPYWRQQQEQRAGFTAETALNRGTGITRRPPQLGANLSAGGGTLQSTNPFADNYQDNTGIFATRFLLDDPGAIDPTMRRRWAESYGRTGNTSEFDAELKTERERQWSTAAQAAWDRQHTAGYQPAAVIGKSAPSLEESLRAGGGHLRPMSSSIPGATAFNQWAAGWQPTGYKGPTGSSATGTPPAGSRPAGLAGVSRTGVAPGLQSPASVAPHGAMPEPQGSAAMPATAARPPMGSTERIRQQQAARGFQGVRRAGIGRRIGHGAY